MFQIVLSLVGLVAGFFCLSLGFALLRFLFRRNAVAKLVNGLDSGIFVEHGMVIDPKTGLVTSQQRPSGYAYRHLL